MMLAECEMMNVAAGRAAGANRSSFSMHHSSFARLGFSFAEVMFAVIVLGIGFIMIAAIFPVAISQSKATNDETAAASFARTEVDSLQNVLTDADLPALTPIAASFGVGSHIFGQVYSLRDPQPDPSPGTLYPWLNVNSPARPGWLASDQLWDKSKGTLISSSDPRFGAVVLYRRDATVASATTTAASPYVQLYVIATQVRNRSLYDPTTLGVDVSTKSTPLPTTPPMVNLQARPVKVAISAKTSTTTNAAGVDLIAFESGNASAQLANAAGADEGCFVIIARDNITGPAAAPPGSNNIGRMNGRIYRVGARRTDLDNNTTIFPGVTKSLVFELVPGGDFTPDPGFNGSLGGIGARQPDDICALGINSAEGTATTFSGRADAFIVGRNLQPGSTLANPIFEGPAQDISIYTTFILPK
jgi:hypothetical protein